MMAVLLLSAMTLGQAQNVPITLNQGWNWISYPYSEPMSISEALSGFTPSNGDMIKSMNNGSSNYLNGRWIGQLYTLIPGQGYHYYSADGTVKSFIFGGVANDPSALPEEALEGEFTVASNGTKVRFSPGNLQCRVDPNQESQITVGTGTSTTVYMPYYTFYNYSLCQMIYKAEELREAGLKAGPVTGIAFESYSTYHYLRTGIKIWLSATTLTAAPSTSVSTSGMTQVYNGTVTQQTGWTEIDFTSSPFTWDGTSNLMVTVVMNHGSYSSSTNWQCSSPGFTCCNYKYNDNNAYDPSSSTYSMYTSTSRPNTRFNGRGGVVWRFAEHQTDCIGTSNANISDTYTGLIDLFGWGTSGHPHGAACFQPWSTSTTDADYYAYGDASNNLFDQTGEADWGCNAISNGGDEPNQWRMLTKEEWSYVLYTRTTPSSKRYAKAQVDGMNGIILLPDNWSTSYYTLNSTNSGSANYTTNTITASQWSTLEQHGAVFLPAAGARYNGTTVDAPGSYGDYWSSTAYDESYCHGLFFTGNSTNMRNDQYRNWALSIRLVCQTNPRIRTLGMTNVTLNTATVNAEVDYTGSTTVTERGVCFGVDVAPTVNNSFQTAGSGAGSFTTQLTNLSAGTTYHVRAYAKMGGTYIYGNELTFTTARQPSVNTAEVNNITATSALCGGTISECGQNVTAKGLCWGTSSSPTISGSHSYDGTGTGSFTSIMTGLTLGTTYYVRAYATTAAGTVYGNQRSFTVTGPEGSITGLFSVSATQQVWFSQGNLQYQASTNTWRFATNQFDYIGYLNGYISSTYSGWIDLFGWGTSGYNHGAVCYQPWSVSETNSDYYAYGSSTYNLYNQTGKADWGYNAINNGGNQTNQWRTLTKDEWEYVFNTRSTASGIRFAMATVNEVYGVILLPDNWNASYYSLNNTNIGNDYTFYNNNIITAEDWVNSLEANGAVFLPITGYRRGSESPTGAGHESPSNGYGGLYWSSSYSDSSNAYYLHFWGMGQGGSSWNTQSSLDRSYGLAVRLVRNAQ